ncbi:PhoD-like phosphatase N-terminal domain-containing protein, partial [Sphingomonas sp. S6]|uniref:PhoD-like phosphatase N-terminal domain-containing protein n=1 Tax=Sphingomonas sp. S6 TaxID=3368600 RepID=UPI00373E24E6
MPIAPIDRRHFLIGAAVAPTILSMAHAATRVDPFALGVAAGEPEPDGFVLWTRIAPDPLAVDGLGGLSGAVPIRWEVAADDRFGRVRQRGVISGVPPGRIVQAALGVICRGGTSSICGVARAVMP